MNRIVCLCAMMVVMMAAVVRADAGLDALVAKVPADANALMMVDVAAMLNTDLADKMGWSVLFEMQAQSGEMLLPPTAKLWVRASHCDVGADRASWDLTLLQLKAAPKMDKLAAHEGGRMDTIGSATAVWSPRDFYALDLGGGIAAAYAPASRQQVTRWYNDAAKRKTSALSPFLAEVVKAADLKATQLVMALDLEGVVSPREAKPDLAAIEVIKGKVADLDQLAEAVASIRGVTLAVSVGERATGTLTVTMGKDVAFMQPYARDLIVHALRKRGMLVIEVQNWEAKAEGNTITMSGPLFASGLRRIGSFFDAPTPHVAVAEDTSKPEEGTTPAPAAPAAQAKPVDPVAASQAYFKAVSAYLDDVYKAEAADSSQLGDAALWMQKYAKKIEQLPIADVDEQLLDWSAFVSAQLTQCSTRLKDVRLRSAKRMAEHSNFYDMEDTGGSPTTLVGVRTGGRDYNRAHSSGYHYDSNNYNYSTYSGYDVYEVQTDVDRYRRKYQEAERKQAGIEEKASGAQDALVIIGELKAETARTRRDMTKKYGVEF